MIAYYGTIGAINGPFGWKRGDKKEVEEWAAEKARANRCYYTLLTEKKAAKVRYRDGRRVFPTRADYDNDGDYLADMDNAE